MVEEIPLEGVSKPRGSEECHVNATRLDTKWVQVIRNPGADKTAGDGSLAQTEISSKGRNLDEGASNSVESMGVPPFNSEAAKANAATTGQTTGCEHSTTLERPEGVRRT